MIKGIGKLSQYDEEDIEAKRMEERRCREEREMRQAKHENVQWGETFKEAVEIMTEVISYPSKYIKDSKDERTVLLDMIRDVTNLAANPEETQKYKFLEEKLRKTEERLRLIEAEVAKKTDAEPAISIDDTLEQEKSSLSKRLDRLEAFLSDQISEQRRFLNKQSPTKKMKISHD